MKRRVWLVLTGLWLLLAAGASAEELRFPAQVQPFVRTELTVEAPADGRLTIRLWNALGEQQPIVKDATVHAGENTFVWDATTYGGMPLAPGACRAMAMLERADGTRHWMRAGFCVESPIATLHYALPCGEVFSHKRASPWFVDCAVTAQCVVNLEIYSDAERTQLAASVRKKVNNSGFFRMVWNGERNGRKLAEGDYYVKVYASGSEDRAFTFPLKVQNQRPAQAELGPTGPLLPAALDDASVWQAITAPIAVVNIDAEDHQRLYAGPTPKSGVVGNVHGQSQGLEVLEVGKTYTRVRAWRHEDDTCVEGYVPTRKLKMVAPNTRYGVLINKATQTLTVYERGKPIAHARVSTGLKAEDKAFRETRRGAFLTTDRVMPFESKGFRYEYAIRIDGGNLIHQVGYRPGANAMDFSEQTAQLGERASEGCVRVDWRAQEEGSINAYWLWTHLPYGTKVLVVDWETGV